MSGEEINIDHMEMDVDEELVTQRTLFDGVSNEFLDYLRHFFVDQEGPSTTASTPGNTILTCSDEQTMLNDLYLACSNESPVVHVPNPLKHLTGAFIRVHEDHSVISTDFLLARFKEVLPRSDVDCLIELSTSYDEMLAGMRLLRKEAFRKRTPVRFLKFLRDTFPSLQNAPGWAGRSAYVTCLTASVFFLLTTELIKREEKFGSDKRLEAHLSTHCSRLLDSPTLVGDKYSVLRENLRRTCRFWYWMHLLLPIETHLKEYLLVASCLEGTGKYHQRASKNPTISYMSYRYLLEMLRGNNAADITVSIRKALSIA